MNKSDTVLPPWPFSPTQELERDYEFEKIDLMKWRQFIKSTENAPVYAVALYLLVIFSLQNYMKERPPLNLKRVLVLWNVTLGAFSILGFLRMGREFYHLVNQPGGLHHSICTRGSVTHSFQFWSIAFAFSKFVELGDTLFIVLRKRPLIFLHWYHHAATLAFVWKAIPYYEPIQRYYGIMNYGIHSLMYPYFALTGMNVKIPSIFAKVLTFLQISQMIIAIVGNVYTLGIAKVCDRSPETINISLAVYGSFAALFIKFFYDKYHMRGKRDSKKSI